MALYTKADGEGPAGQYLSVNPLLARDGEITHIPKHRLPERPMMADWPTRSSTRSSCSTATPA